MFDITGKLVLAATFGVVAVWSAGAATADPISGSYHGLMTDGAGAVLNSQPVLINFGSCGADCVSMTPPSGPAVQLRLNGANYVGGYDWQGAPCTTVLDPNALVLTDDCPGGPIQRFVLTRA